jgi:hypothetical protein
MFLCFMSRGNNAWEKRSELPVYWITFIYLKNCDKGRIPFYNSNNNNNSNSIKISKIIIKEEPKVH